MPLKETVRTFVTGFFKAEVLEFEPRGGSTQCICPAYKGAKSIFSIIEVAQYNAATSCHAVLAALPLYWHAI